MENIKIIHKSLPYYPKSLLKLENSPDILFAIGNVNLLDTFSISIVGARACSEESILLTKQLTKNLVNHNITILSGMAYGIDQVAHETCIENNGNTIAIIAAGFNNMKSRKILHKILENNGLILSEYFPDMPAFKCNFQRRNQLIVALSNAVVAVEAHLKSGTMITAKEALKQNVPLFTFPGGFHDERYLGNNYLLTQGAFCINNNLNIIDSIKGFYPNQEFKTFNISNNAKKAPEQFKELYSLLSKTPQSINELAKKSNKALSEIQSTLVLMELEDLVYKMKNNCYVKK